MALGLFREISFYTITADETADISNKEQLVICICWVDENFVVHEDFLGIHLLERTTADDIVFIIKDALLRINPKIQNACGKCYDGTATIFWETKVCTEGCLLASSFEFVRITHKVKQIQSIAFSALTGRIFALSFFIHCCPFK